MRRPHEAAFGELKRSGTLIPVRHDGSSSPLCSLDPASRSKPAQPALLPISGRRPRKADGRARKRLADRVRVNDLASRPQTEITRSRFPACLRRFATRGCVRRGLSRWASAVARPRHWPTVAGVLADCLSMHRETSRPKGPWFTIPEAEVHELRSS